VGAGEEGQRGRKEGKERSVRKALCDALCVTACARAVPRILVRGGGLKSMGWGQAKPDRPRAGVRFLGRGQPSPSPSALGDLGNAVSSPSGVRGGAPATQAVSCIL